MLGVLPFLDIQGQSVIRADEEKWRYRTRPIYLTCGKYGSLDKKPELLYLVPGAARNMLFFDCALLCMRSDVGIAAPLIVPSTYTGVRWYLPTCMLHPLMNPLCFVCGTDDSRGHVTLIGRFPRAR